MVSSSSRYAQGSRSVTGPSIALHNPAAIAEGGAIQAIEPRAVQPREKPQPVGARSMQTILERSFPPEAREAEPVEVKPSEKKRFAIGAAARRFAKVVLGIGLVVAFGWTPLRAMLATTSVEAIVNARIDTIRAPIEGIVQAPAEKNANWSATAA